MKRNALHALVLVTALSACSDSDTAQSHIDRANGHFAAGETSSALIELKNALQKDAQSAEARWLLGSAYLAMGDAVAAEKELSRAQRLGCKGCRRIRS